MSDLLVHIPSFSLSGSLYVSLTSVGLNNLSFFLNSGLEVRNSVKLPIACRIDSLDRFCTHDTP